jgi:hypothetical protein
MADDANDDGRDDARTQITKADREEYGIPSDVENEEDTGILYRQQKILAKIICIPGKKTYVAEWMKQAFEIILEVDPEAVITTPSGMTIHHLTEFPTGKKFKDAFNPVQSNDTKKINMTFTLTSAPALKKIKNKHRRLVDHLQKHQIYLNESISGSDEEALIGYFLGIKADKLYVTGFSDDLREIIMQTQLQSGEKELLKKAREQLEWPEDHPPPFYVKVRNITRHIKGVEFSSKAIGIIVAQEHAVFFKTLLTRACDENIFPGMGKYYNVLRNDRTFPQIIKWHNDHIANTVTIPVLGISREAMLQPISTKQDGETTTLRKELSKSILISAIHSTKQTCDEGRWILVLPSKTHTEAAIKFFHSTISAIYSIEESPIKRNDLIITTPLPKIEPREESHARSTHSTRNLQANAWASIMDDTHNLDEGSQMPNKTRVKQRKRVEISFDPESKEQFPDLQNKSPDKQKPRSPRKEAQKNDQMSPNSSQSESIISNVTRAEFENFSQNIGKMVRDEVQSTISNSTDQTMLTIYREELAANRKDTQNQMKMLQQQMAHFHTLLANMTPQTNTQNNLSTPTHSNAQTTNDNEFFTPTNAYTTPATQEDHEPPTTKRVHMEDHSMPDNVSHHAPSITEPAPTAKRTRATTPTSQNKTKLSQLQPTTSRNSHRTASKVPIPSKPPSTTTGKKADGGKS